MTFLNFGRLAIDVDRGEVKDVRDRKGKFKPLLEKGEIIIEEGAFSLTINPYSGDYEIEGKGNVEDKIILRDLQDFLESIREFRNTYETAKVRIFKPVVEVNLSEYEEEIEDNPYQILEIIRNIIEEYYIDVDAELYIGEVHVYGRGEEETCARIRFSTPVVYKINRKGNWHILKDDEIVICVKPNEEKFVEYVPVHFDDSMTEVFVDGDGRVSVGD